MLANFFDKSKPINFIVVVSLFFCYFFVINSGAFSSNTFFENLISITEILFLFLGIFFFFNFIVTRNNLTFDHSYAFLFFIIFLSFFCNTFLTSKSLILFLLHLFFLRKIYSLQSSKSIFKKLYDAGFWLGILFILTPFAIFYIVLLYIALYLHQKIYIRTFLIPIIGFITPLFFCFFYYFWIDSTDDFLSLFYIPIYYNPSIYLKDEFLFPFALIGFCTIISLLLKSVKALSVNNTFRRSWILLFFNLLISFCFVVFSPQKYGSEILFLLFSTAIIVANGIEILTNSFVRNVFLILFLLSCSVPLILKII